MAVSSDRNLLFGIVALQMDLITRDTLIAAMNAWVLDKERTLGELLEEQGALAAGDRALLEPLVNRHIEQHGGDAAQSLASLSSVEWIRHGLAAHGPADAEFHVSLNRLRSTSVESDPHATEPHIGAAGPPGARFRILKFHARGGLGEVFVAEDAELHREVALKQIQDRHAGHSESRSRFLLEAEITGGLEHPGIVPVYGLGHNELAGRFTRCGLSRETACGRRSRGSTTALQEPRSPVSGCWRFRSCCGGFWTCVTRSGTRTAGGCCIGTSSPGTSWWVSMARRWWSTGAWPRWWVRVRVEWRVRCGRRRRADRRRHCRVRRSARRRS